MNTERGKVTALDSTKRAFRIHRHWYYAQQSDLRRLRLDDNVEVSFVTQEGRRKAIEVKVVNDS